MNMPFKPQLLAPCFPAFELNTSCIEIDGDKIQFTLEYGCVSIDCEAVANELSDTAYVEHQFDPEGGCDVPYTKLKVDQNTSIFVLRHDVDLINDQVLQLTENQIEKLNQQLEYICIELLEKKQVA